MEGGRLHFRPLNLKLHEGSESEGRGGERGVRDGHGHGGATAMPLAAESRSRTGCSDVGRLAHWTTSSPPPPPLTVDPCRFRRKTWRKHE